MGKFNIYIVLAICSFLLISCSSKEKGENVIQTMRDLQQTGNLVVRFAKLKIDSTRLGEYKRFLKEGIETSVKTEPGVLTMYAVEEENDPTNITVLEVYASDSAYQSHLRTPHFQKYKTGTLDMIMSLELVDLEPIVFGVR